ncbi:class Ia ribonucleoside-diphosphate reductase subunit beta [Saccharospirillum alexandrii]|uniref:class Ia ribonucleoside-diphosphate reductase subunit beta n=1 Tax=Saccharospirillum alexandrii TaxID=2448477 RepID=UPI000FD748F1|nr:class Ia ribonucleoside-diphosphate reductase subunit beta [Saccharospirillum alexandrii]
MAYQTFNQREFDTFSQPMFFGETVNVARYDQQKFPIFEKLIEKQLSFFWRPEEVDLTRDRKDFIALPAHEQHIFLSNLKYQTLLDSVQGRSPNVALLPLVSLPELETWIETWAFSETIHSRSYTHIMRNVLTEPGKVFDDIVHNPAIVERATTVTRYYDALIEATQRFQVQTDEWQASADGKKALRDLKRKLYLTLASVNVLEAIRFYVSFACSFAFAERSRMEGNAKIIRLIARDEALHLTGTQHMLNLMARGHDDPEMAEIAAEERDNVRQIFIDAAEQEKEWAAYLFKDGSMIGLNTDILAQYVQHITDQRLAAIDLEPAFGSPKNPLPWMDAWLQSDQVQVAPQETEISTYLVGALQSDVDTGALEDFEL